MNTVAITCPKCQFSRDVPRENIPAAARRVNCPKCSASFPLQLPETTPESPPPTPSTPDISAAEKVDTQAATSAAPPPPPATTEDAGDTRPRAVPFEFTGTARDYFGIWIVNALLKVITLGIYSPWAKVRKRRFFFGHTLIDRANFDYLADPMALLRGWLLGIAIFFGYSLVGNLIPLIGQLFGLLFLLAVVPWLVVRSRMFNTRYSSHRNIRFSFYPDYREAYIAYAGFTLLSILTLGILLPYTAWRQKRFLVENARYGRTPFTFHARPREFYLLALKTLGMLILVVAFFAAGTLAVTGTLSFYSTAWVADTTLPILIVFSYLTAYLLLILFWQVRVINLTWSSTRLGPHQLVSRLRTRDMLWIYLSSAVAIILSFGLLIPWAAVRLARYRISRTSMMAHGDLGTFVSAVSHEVNAIGEEVGDVFDIDIEIGF